MLFGQDSEQLYIGNSNFVEDLYQRFLEDPQSVDDRWRAYFSTLRNGGGDDRMEPTPEEIRTYFRDLEAVQSATTGGHHSLEMARKQAAVLRLIQAYRLFGHLRAVTDPLSLRGQPRVPDLDPAHHGLTDQDLDLHFNTGNLGGIPDMTLREIIAMLKETYTESIGSEFMHIYDLEQKEWIQRQLEATRTNPDYPSDFKVRLLERLTAAEGLEQILHNKYVGQKRFSLEGGETLITSLDELIERGGIQGLEEVVIGMAHRGRLNVLVNIMGKHPSELFSEFEGQHKWREGLSGDVKYHQGYSTTVDTPGGIVRLALGYNPSHLEIVGPVTIGSVRSRQELRGLDGHLKVLPVIIHGDAAVAGQGVVYETVNLALTRGYNVGGTIHIVVNNRIGFTTSHPLDSRSMLYCTDVGKVIQAPIFHVNGDDPEAVAFITQLALNYRMKFHRDVFIDIICYRRHGHNEADEPAATQPMMYKKIRKRPTVRDVYAERLAREKVVKPDQAAAMVASYAARLESGEPVLPNIVTGLENPYRKLWMKHLAATWRDPGETAVTYARLKRLGQALVNLPEDLELHPRVAKIIDDRAKMAAGALPLDWGFCEVMAYATLLEDGFGVRISGQDSGRGTFFHRHAVLHSMRNGDEYIPLQHLAEDQPSFRVIDSILSEEAVLAFEYGFSTANPNTLVIWEAQFGDFVNGAQVVIDQFISAAEQKWGLLTGLVMFLPHGSEGQGPEHTSARLERFLQLCAQENMQVCYPSTPAQMFHMLRREMVRPLRKPLIVMTPKSTLRRKISFSSLDDLAGGSFQLVINEIDSIPDHKVERVVLCSGKVYFDLLEARRERGIDNIAILRIEQLYPFPQERLTLELSRYSNASVICWAQEEPQNQGAWYSIQHAIRLCMRDGQNLVYAGRMPMAAPAGGDYQKHLKRQQAVVDDALTLDVGPGSLHASQQPQLVAHQPPQPQLGDMKP
ncbi:MAG TPA: 2-oxoglutarate dehydrogenase E1 component [Kiritimatiellia bacterium]|nr:2-oxoglutarate dehydrogenase E1 component [Kiritimatiellia bacterium]